MGDDLELKQRKLQLLEEGIKLRKNLPHLYGWKNYPWMREFLECTTRTMFLTAANQIGKSSVQIRKVIDWATNQSIWPILWPGRTPRQFWYLYPSRELATNEFDTKWVPDFMPRGEMIDHPIYGWKANRNSKREIISVKFNSGIMVFFKTYMQDAAVLQSSSVDYIACDEELPEDLYDELNIRRTATNGYFSMVFTATLAQEVWRRTMEPKRGERALFPEAWKKQISSFDCREYEDGSPSPWTDEKIRRSINSCKADAEVQKRIYGKFVADSGKKFGGFERSRNMCPPFIIPSDWLHYAGVDIGAGGKENHPSTISLVAVKPDYSMGVVYKHWRGDDELTTMTDVANKYVEMTHNISMTQGFYDYHARDFKTITDRMGLSIEAAEKGQEIGEQVLNTLFRNQMLFIFDIPETEPVVRELLSLLKGTDKRKAKDDSVDSVRYGVTKIPWDWTKVGQAIRFEAPPKPTYTPLEEANQEREKHRKNMFKDTSSDDFPEITHELERWGEFYDL